MNASAPPKEKRGCNTALNTADNPILICNEAKSQSRSLRLES
jgi:hypothetical protein